LIAAGVFFILVAQAWVLVRNAVRVRLVVYNDSSTMMAEAALVCGAEVAVLGELAVEDSRHAWFRPPEASSVVVLKWVDETGSREAGWPVERGERLTVRVGLGGEASVSRERASGRRLFDLVMSP
jgi:hypothetical protein